MLSVALLIVLWALQMRGWEAAPQPIRTDIEPITIGVILPYSGFQSKYRALFKKLQDTVDSLRRGKHHEFKFFRYFDLKFDEVRLPSVVSPIGKWLGGCLLLFWGA